ncbi:Pectinesterase, Tyr active site [Trema orientale]|uniref:Pectinesterase n=1 Tax=Trema orientale TaxID=63057 RepID=A0A2P5F3Y6_TREOI|nr:Pectinesterase, Tyr active site [Trema orientale]
MSFCERSFRLCFAFLLVLGVEVASGQWHKRDHDLDNRSGGYRRIIVDQSGHGDFMTIQSAIDSVPSFNKYWVYIIVRAGIYWEKIVIPYNKPFIILKGEGDGKTQVVWGDHESVAQSPTFTSSADNTIVQMIGFTNSYNHPANNNPRVPAVAAMVSGDRTRFYKCGFYGLQDTLWDDRGRHYYESCTIEGAVDFIFGSGQSIFEGCFISVIGGDLGPGFVGFITAQGRAYNNEANGFVFKNCQVYGTGSVFLGRPWRPYSRVLFYGSNFSNVIVPQGWNAWQSIGYEGQLTFAEDSCYGPGSDTSQRVGWEKKLSKDAVEQLISLSYIDKEQWLEHQPF